MRVRVAYRVVAGILVTLAGLLVVYAMSENDYRADGRSRWDSYDARGITVAAVAACALEASLLIWVSRRREQALGASCIAIAGVGFAVGLWLLAIVGNTAN